jgi:hypothetical protein
MPYYQYTIVENFFYRYFRGIACAPAIEERYAFFLYFGFEEAKGLFNLKGGDADLRVWRPSVPQRGCFIPEE